MLDSDCNCCVLYKSSSLLLSCSFFLKMCTFSEKLFKFMILAKETIFMLVFKKKHEILCVFLKCYVNSDTIYIGIIVSNKVHILRGDKYYD